MPPPARRRAPQKEPLRVVRQKQGLGLPQELLRAPLRPGQPMLRQPRLRCSPPNMPPPTRRWQPWRPNGAAGSRIVQDLLQAGM